MAGLLLLQQGLSFVEEEVVNMADYDHLGYCSTHLSSSLSGSTRVDPGPQMPRWSISLEVLCNRNDDFYYVQRNFLSVTVSTYRSVQLMYRKFNSNLFILRGQLVEELNCLDMSRNNSATSSGDRIIYSYLLY